MRLLIKNLLFTAIVPGTVAVLIPLAIVGDEPAAAGVARLAGAALLATGGALYASCVWHFARFGRGTPAPIDAPVKLVARGPYQYVRNPMYVAVLTVVLGWAARYASASLVCYAAVLGVVFHGFIVGYEEPHLRRLFPDEFDAYRDRVGRWVPRLSRPPESKR